VRIRSSAWSITSLPESISPSSFSSRTALAFFAASTPLLTASATPTVMWSRASAALSSALPTADSLSLTMLLLLVRVTAKKA
jgi:hypothetical protein